MSLLTILKGSLNSKTQWVNGLAVLSGALLENTDLLTTILGTVSAGKAIAILGAINMVIRAFTTKSLAQKAK